DIPVQDGVHQGFGDAESWSADAVLGVNNPLPNINIGGAVVSGSTAISGELSRSRSVSGFLGWSIDPGKSNSFGVSLTGSASEGRGVLQLVDIDGDGLPDKVFEHASEGFKYQRNLGGQGFDAPTSLSIPALSGNAGVTVSL